MLRVLFFLFRPRFFWDYVVAASVRLVWVRQLSLLVSKILLDVSFGLFQNAFCRDDPGKPTRGGETLEKREAS